MSNSIAPGSSADVNVKVTVLTTNPNVPITYKTIILKKNLVNGVNTLTQAIMNQTNTKYVIKYDYVLGDDIIVPENCILEFDGGSITASGNNDTITPNNTIINSISDNPIFVDVSFGTDSSHYFVDTKLVFTNFGAVSDMTSIAGTYTYNGQIYNANIRTGTDNTSAFNSIAQFLSYSKNIRLNFNGSFYSTVGKCQIYSATNLYLYGGELIKCLYLIGCTFSEIDSVNIVGLHEGHTFPSDVSSDQELGGCGVSVVGVDAAIFIGSTTDGRENIDGCHIKISNCHFEMVKNGVLCGSMGGNSVSDVSINNCTGSYIIYHHIAFSGIRCNAENCHADYVMQAYDISTGSLNCLISNCSSDRVRCGSKIGNSNNDVPCGYNKYENLTEIITDDYVVGFEMSDIGFWIYGQSYPSSFENCSIIVNRNGFDSVIQVSAYDAIFKNISVTGTGEATKLICGTVSQDKISVDGVSCYLNVNNAVNAAYKTVVKNLNIDLSAINNSTISISTNAIVYNSIIKAITVDTISSAKLINCNIQCTTATLRGDSENCTIISSTTTDKSCIYGRLKNCYLENSSTINLYVSAINSTLIWNDINNPAIVGLNAETPIQMIGCKFLNMTIKNRALIGNNTTLSLFRDNVVGTNLVSPQ